MKLKLKIDDPHTRKVWEAILRAKEEVASWPAWKRGDDVQQSEDVETQVESLHSVVRKILRFATRLQSQ